MIDPAVLIGTWQLVETRAHDDDGRPIRPPYGGTGLGVLSFDRTGRMVAVLCEGGEIAPGESREYSSYCGTYSFDGETLVTRVDATAEPTRMGSDQVRKVTMEDGRLVLRPAPRPWKGLMQHRALIWEKIRPAPG